MTRTRIVLVFAVTMIIFALGNNLLFAQEIVVNIKFPFKAGGVSFPAGKYRIETNATDREHVIVLRNMDTSKAEAVTYLTRLSDREKPYIVFDKIGDQYVLSEVYIAGIDGYQMSGVKEKHTHVKVTQG